MSSSTTPAETVVPTCIPASTFRRLVKDVAGLEYNVSAEALRLLQDASEGHVADLMNKSAALAAYSDRNTVYASDFDMVRRLAR